MVAPSLLAAQQFDRIEALARDGGLDRRERASRGDRLTAGLELRAKDECRWDLVALGEVMLRLDPGEERISTTRSFRAWEGGGEYNVARGLRKCFGLRTSIVTALADNPVGRLVEDLILQGGVDTRHIVWVPYDGVGRTARNGLNFTERGFGLRGALGCSDRGHTAVSQLRPGEIDWHELFSGGGARWFHCGGIFAGLSETTAEVADEAMTSGACGRRGRLVRPQLPTLDLAGDRRFDESDRGEPRAGEARRCDVRQRGGLQRRPRLRDRRRRRRVRRARPVQLRRHARAGRPGLPEPEGRRDEPSHA